MLVSRMFATNGDALSAVADLKQAGFGDDRIQVIEKTESAIDAKYVLLKGVSDETRAGLYADGVTAGKTLVIVDAPLGTSGTASAILEGARPGDGDVPGKAYAEAMVRPEAAPFDPTSATPLSTKFNWPVLLNDPAPLSNYFKWRTLSPPPTEKPTSHGLPFLSNDPTPLSSRLGLKVLSDDPAPFSSLIGRKVLSDDPAPLSSWLKKKVLIDNPTPLSSWLKIPVLKKGRTTYS